MTPHPTDEPPPDPPPVRRRELAALVLSALAVAVTLVLAVRRPEQPNWGYGAIFVMSVITVVLPGPKTVLGCGGQVKGGAVGQRGP